MTATARIYAPFVEALAPGGKLSVIDDPGTLDVVALKRKAALLPWEFMFSPLDVEEARPGGAGGAC